MTATAAVVLSSVESCGGELSDLEYPKTLSAAEREEAGKKLAGLPADLAQQLLDELAARIRANVIQTTPLAYLRGLITRLSVVTGDAYAQCDNRVRILTGDSTGITLDWRNVVQLER
jgi:hypothetical protein